MQPNELALKAGRQLQSDKTGFIHHPHQEMIPSFENTCFAKALIQSRIVDNVLEGRALLAKLSRFEVDGNYPVFLHEYPNCQDPHLKERLAQECPEQDPTHWHPLLGIYTGPGRRYQEHYEPAVTFDDLCLAAWTNIWPKRLLKLHPMHIRASLIPERELQPIDHPVPWIHFDGNLHIAWGDLDRVHTLALIGYKATIDDDAIVIELPEELPDTETKMLEVSLFVDHHPNHNWTVNGKKANTFLSEDTLELVSKGFEMTLQFEGEGGQFCGHLMRGNRPDMHGKDPFSAYDWRIVLRTIRREKNAKLRLTLRQGLENRPLLPSHASRCQRTESSQ